MTTAVDPVEEHVQQTGGKVSETPDADLDTTWHSWPISLAIAVAFVAVAEVSARQAWVADYILPAPSRVAITLYRGFASGLYWEHLASTLFATLAGFAISAIAALCVAGVLATFRPLERIFLPFIIAFQTVPKIAIAPLVIIWMGFGTGGKTFIVVIVSFFPVLVNTLQGLRIRNREQWELTVALGATRYQLFRYIRVPNAIPYIFAGLHISVIFALIGAVVAEFVGSAAGLGYLLISAKAQFNVPGVFAILAIFMVIGLTLHLTMNALERRMAFWAEDVAIVNP